MAQVKCTLELIRRTAGWSGNIFLVGSCFESNMIVGRMNVFLQTKVCKSKKVLIMCNRLYLYFVVLKMFEL